MLRIKCTANDLHLLREEQARTVASPESISQNKTRKDELNKENRSSSRNLQRKYKAPPRCEPNALSSAITLVAPARRRRPIAGGDVNAMLNQSVEASPSALSVAASCCEFLSG